jgi:hypothetical protein
VWARCGVSATFVTDLKSFRLKDVKAVVDLVSQEEIENLSERCCLFAIAFNSGCTRILVDMTSASGLSKRKRLLAPSPPNCEHKMITLLPEDVDEEVDQDDVATCTDNSQSHCLGTLAYISRLTAGIVSRQSWGTADSVKRPFRSIYFYVFLARGTISLFGFGARCC